MAKHKIQPGPPYDVITDGRYPYTHSADLIRMAAGYGQHGTKLSRCDAGKIRQMFAKALNMDDEALAKVLANYYLANQSDIEGEALREILTFLDKG